MIEIRALASGSSGNCYYITDGESPLLIECGLPWKQIQRGVGFKTSDVAGCLISHEHKDHCKAVEDVARHGIDCYMSRGTAEAIGIAGHRVKCIGAREQTRIGTWTVLAFETQHDAEEPLGFLLASQAGKLLYVTDTYYVRYRFRGLTQVMVECNYASDILQANVASGEVPSALKNRLLKSHFSLENVKSFLKANDLSQVEEIWLIHLSSGNSDAGRFQAEIEALTGKPVIVA